MLKKIRKYTISIWIIVLAIFWIYILNHREILDPKNFAALIQWFWSGAIIVYGLVFLFRWILLVPSTPLILVGMLLFPNSPHIVFIISMMGIIFSSLVIYRFSDLLWLDEYFEEHNHNNKKMEYFINKYWFFAVAFWSFFLVLPTDLVCYIAGMVRMNIYKFIAWVFVWEGLIIWLFIYGWKWLLERITHSFL